MDEERKLASESETPKRQSVEHRPSQQTTSVTDELNTILTMLKEACPENAAISFDFDGRLHVHIDVHDLEEVLKVETILPTLGAGIFHDLVRRDTPHHPFMNRVSAVVNR